MSEVWHKMRRRSWWDGSVESWCGQRWPAKTYQEAWLPGSRPACPACKAAQKNAK